MFRPWRVATKSKADRHYGGRVVAVEVPDANLFLAIQTPNGGVNDECDKLAAKIVESVNQVEIYKEHLTTCRNLLATYKENIGSWQEAMYKKLDNLLK